MYAAATNTMSNALIDLRSDTVSRPSAGMRRAMAEAEVGDDVYNDDPTVRRLEERVAGMLGKDDALFVASGTQSNLIALLSHCGRGDEYIGGVGYHIPKYEAAGAAVLGGISPRHIRPKTNGALDAAEIAANVQPDDAHFARTRLVCVENTFNGAVIAQDDMDAVADVCAAHDLALHLDGARLMNASVATGADVGTLTARMDTVSLCLSKGLGAPVGSVLSGPKEFISQAKRNRKMLGGGLRQSGVLAACGLYALDNNVDRLAQDHANAAALGERLASMDAIALAQPVDTNMVWLTIDVPGGARSLAAFMADRGIMMADPGADGGLRLVAHLDFDAGMVDAVVDAFAAWFDA